MPTRRQTNRMDAVKEHFRTEDAFHRSIKISLTGGRTEYTAPLPAIIILAKKPSPVSMLAIGTNAVTPTGQGLQYFPVHVAVQEFLRLVRGESPRTPKLKPEARSSPIETNNGSRFRHCRNGTTFTK
jgi:hypothetical protein